MRELTNGFWGTVDRSLQRVGRIAACAVSRRGRSAEDVACAAIGGSLLCAIFGGVVGFALSDLSRHTADLSRTMAAIEGLIVGLLLGACVGVFFGSFVEAVDHYIRNLLRTLNPK
jgi:hypothetical protein